MDWSSGEASPEFSIELSISGESSREIATISGFVSVSSREIATISGFVSVLLGSLTGGDIAVQIGEDSINDIHQSAAYKKKYTSYLMNQRSYQKPEKNIEETKLGDYIDVEEELEHEIVNNQGVKKSKYVNNV